MKIWLICILFFTLNGCSLIYKKENILKKFRIKGSTIMFQKNIAQHLSLECEILIENFFSNHYDIAKEIDSSKYNLKRYFQYVIFDTIVKNCIEISRFIFINNLLTQSSYNSLIFVVRDIYKNSITEDKNNSLKVLIQSFNEFYFIFMTSQIEIIQQYNENVEKIIFENYELFGDINNRDLISLKNSFSFSLYDVIFAAPLHLWLDDKIECYYFVLIFLWRELSIALDQTVNFENIRHKYLSYIAKESNKIRIKPFFDIYNLTIDSFKKITSNVKLFLLFLESRIDNIEILTIDKQKEIIKLLNCMSLFAVNSTNIIPKKQLKESNKTEEKNVFKERSSNPFINELINYYYCRGQINDTDFMVYDVNKYKDNNILNNKVFFSSIQFANSFVTLRNDLTIKNGCYLRNSNLIIVKIYSQLKIITYDIIDAELYLKENVEKNVKKFNQKINLLGYFD